MAAHTLTPAEQKGALSKRKNKRILKNVLSLHKCLKVESLITAHSEVENLKHILERLLPSARLSIQKNLKCKNPSEEKALTETAQLKRKQLSLGVNNLSKSIKNGLISAALLAGDIEPKFLIHHLNLLCSHNKIPYIHMVGLREITKKCLGFPCIALGFRNTSAFSEAIHEIKTLSVGLKKSDNCEKSDRGSERVTEEVANVQNDELSFTYLYRNSRKQRMFIPENLSYCNITDGFIRVDKVADVKPKKGISSASFCFIKKKSERKLKVKEDSTSEEDFEVPRKKPKKSWAFDGIRNKQKPRYHPINLAKISSNPNRVGRKGKI